MPADVELDLLEQRISIFPSADKELPSKNILITHQPKP
jgi:hypothetical protein